MVATAGRFLAKSSSPGHGVKGLFIWTCVHAAMSQATHHAQAVHAAIQSMGGTVLIARALVQSGRRIDLEGLDRDATALCAAVLALASDQGRLLRPALEGLLRQVDDLAAEVARH